MITGVVASVIVVVTDPVPSKPRLGAEIAVVKVSVSSFTVSLNALISNETRLPVLAVPLLLVMLSSLVDSS